MFRKISILAAALLVACKSQESAGTEHFPGKYELFIGTNQTYARRDFVESLLSLNADGTYEQVCTYQDAAKDSKSAGKWHTSGGNGGIQFEGLLDCAGVWAGNWIGYVSLIVEYSSKPQILLDPDANIFYRKVDK